MKLPLTALAIAIPLAACMGDLSSGPLSGNWGGASLQVTATPARIAMTLTCDANIQIAHGVLVDGAGRFTVLDTLRGSLAGGMFDTLPGPPTHPAVAVLITGQLTDDVVTISLQVNYPATTTTAPLTFTGRRGQPPDFSGICRL